MKKFVLSVMVMISFGAYVVWQNITNSNSNILPVAVSTNNDLSKKNNSNINTTTPTTPITSKTPKVPVATSNSFFSNIFSGDDSALGEDDNSFNQNSTSILVTNNTPTNNSIAPAPKKQGLYTDGTYTGDSVFAYNDSLQVKVIILNGKINDIQFVHYPNRGRSANISSFALPALKQEAIQAQSAKINAVSGASYTSPALIQSLASALAQAKA